MAYGHNLTHTSATDAYWDGQSMFSDTLRTTQDASTLGCNRVALSFGRTTPGGSREDVAVFTLAIAKIVGGGQYGVLVSADRTAAETALDAWYANHKSYVASAYTLLAYTWHEHRANHPATDKGYETIGPAVKTTLKSVAGTAASGRQPDQVAATVTLRTTSRKHWGRFYLPGVPAGENDTTYGRLRNISVDTMLGYVHTLESDLNTASLQLGVWTWKFQAFLQLSELRMDNVWDIQRRRRAKQTTYFKNYVS